MKVKPLQVVAWLLWTLSMTGLLTAFFLDSSSIDWALATLISYGIVRLEWFISTLTEAKKSDDTYEQEYDGL